MESTSNDTPTLPDEKPQPRWPTGLALSLIMGAYLLVVLVMGPILNPQPHTLAFVAVPVDGATAIPQTPTGYRMSQVSDRAISSEYIKALEKEYNLDKPGTPVDFAAWLFQSSPV